MDKYFTFSNNISPFVTFSKEHFAAIIVLLAVYTLLYLNRERLAGERTDRACRYTIAAMLILQEISLNVWRILQGTWSQADSLPLHLCGFMVMACPIMLVTKSYRMYEIIYFLALGGASQAILTPDIGAYGFPHFRFYQFFVSHGLIILSVLYMLFVYGYKPKLTAFFKSFAILNAALPFIGIINWLTGGNYFFIARKPDTASILDLLGPWPWYIIPLEAIGFILLLVPYLPLAAAGAVKRSAEHVEL